MFGAIRREVGEIFKEWCLAVWDRTGGGTRDGGSCPHVLGDTTDSTTKTNTWKPLAPYNGASLYYPLCG